MSAEVVVRLWAAARDAAGTSEERHAPGSLAAVVAELGERHGDRLARVLAVSSYLVDGDPVGTRDPATVQLAAGSTLEVLPPFAGG